MCGLRGEQVSWVLQWVLDHCGTFKHSNHSAMFAALSDKGWVVLFQLSQSERGESRVGCLSELRTIGRRQQPVSHTDHPVEGGK